MFFCFGCSRCKVTLTIVVCGRCDQTVTNKRCPDCVVAYNKSYYANNAQRLRSRSLQKSAWLEEMKSRPCADCRRSFPACAMDFDHLDPKLKSITIGNRDSSQEALRAEVQKCEIVCSNCHRIRTQRRIDEASASLTKRQRSYLVNRQRLRDLKSHPCLDCNECFPPEAMEFDHRPGELKAFPLAQAPNRSWKSVLKEVAKCDLVCSNCHRVRTRQRKLYAADEILRKAG